MTDIRGAALPDRFLRVDQVAVRTHRGAHAHAETEVARDCGRPRVIQVVGSLDAELDQIETHLLDARGEPGECLRVHGRRPHPRVDTNLRHDAPR
jgi:hypothetical protein